MWDALIITPFVNVLLFIYNITGQNFGIAIILFTILIRLITHPLTVQQIKGGAAMQNLQNNEEWKEIQEKHKGDKEKLAQEQMRIYKELGVNPFASCLPLIIQLPIIFGLYQALMKTMSNTPLDMLSLTRHAWPWLLNINDLIPLNNNFLWMNLGTPERLNIPGLSFGIPVLAILVMISTYMQSKLMAPPTANPKDQTAQMTNMMNLYMPLIMGWMSWTLASGLALYFVVTNLFSIAQYALLGKANWKNLLPGKKTVVQEPVKPTTKRGKNESRKNNARSNRANS